MFAENDQESLEVLYHARGQEIKRLQGSLNDLQSSRATEVRQLRHEIALLKVTYSTVIGQMTSIDKGILPFTG